MNSSEFDHNDEGLLRDLKAAVAEESAVPERARDIARGTFTWRAIDDELLLALCFDSATDEVRSVRGEGAVARRSLSFENGTLGVEIEVNERSLAGQLLPPQTGEVSLLTADGPYADATADTAGCFFICCPQRGPVRLVCSVADGVLSTEWVSL